MPRHHNVNNMKIAFTSEEEAAKDVQEAVYAAGADARAAAQVQANRRAAYQAEADHLHLEEERGEVPVGTWTAKVAEIKQRFPK